MTRRVAEPAPRLARLVPGLLAVLLLSLGPLSIGPFSLGPFSIGSFSIGPGALQAQAETHLPPLDCVRLMRAARIAGMEGDIERERELLRQAIERFPREVAPVYALLMHHRLHPLPADQHEHFRQALRTRLGDLEQRLPLAALHSVVSDPAADEETVRLLTDHFSRRLETATDERPQILHSLAVLHDRLQQREQAVAALQELHEIAPSTPMTWALYRSLVALERWDEAIAVFEELLAEDTEGNLESAHVLLLGRAGRSAEQIRAIERYLRDTEAATESETENRWLSTLMASAWTLRDAGQDDEARALFEKVVALYPENERAQTVFTHLYGSAEQRAEIRARDDLALQAEEDPQRLFDLGTERLASGDAEGALELLRRAAPAFPRLEAAWYNLGMAAYQTADWATAQEAFERAAKLNPERAESFFFRGMALNQLEDCRRTVTALERALALDPSRTTAHYYLAACYRNLGDHAAAERHRRLDAAARER